MSAPSQLTTLPINISQKDKEDTKNCNTINSGQRFVLNANAQVLQCIADNNCLHTK